MHGFGGLRRLKGRLRGAGRPPGSSYFSFMVQRCLLLYFVAIEFSLEEIQRRMVFGSQHLFGAASHLPATHTTPARR